jgi:hypothetical protein
MADAADPYAGLKDLPPTSLPGPDAGRMSDIANEIRRHVNDPKGIFADRPDLRDKVEQSIRTVFAGANLAEPQPETPLARAQRQHAEAFADPEVPPALAEMLHQRIAALTALGEYAVAHARDALRDRLGAATYDQMVTDARQAHPGEVIPPATLADESLLKFAAARGRFVAARERTRPRG